MAITPMPDFEDGETLDEGALNTILANIAESAPSKALAAGDMFRGVGVGEIERVPISNNGSIWAMIGGVAGWLDGNGKAYRMPRVKADNSGVEFPAGLNLAQAPVHNSATAQNMALFPTAHADIVTQSFTTHGGLVVVLGFITNIESKSGAAQYVHFAKLRRDTTDIGQERSVSSYVGGAQTGTSSFAMLAFETPAAGTYTYRVQSQYSVSTNTTGTPTASAQILIVEFAP